MALEGIESFPFDPVDFEDARLAGEFFQVDPETVTEFFPEIDQINHLSHAQFGITRIRSYGPLPHDLVAEEELLGFGELKE
jgi:hypothetical protein